MRVLAIVLGYLFGAFFTTMLVARFGEEYIPDRERLLVLTLVALFWWLVLPILAAMMVAKSALAIRKPRRKGKGNSDDN